MKAVEALFVFFCFTAADRGFSTWSAACMGGAGDRDIGWLRVGEVYADLLILTAAHSEIVNRHTPHPREPVCAPSLEHKLLCGGSRLCASPNFTANRPPKPSSAA
jgi:hypothetical protein